jgi:hypothetical protein
LQGVRSFVRWLCCRMANLLRQLLLRTTPVLEDLKYEQEDE